MSINWVEIRELSTTPDNINDPVDIVIDCPHEDSALDIAIYMVDEIQRNTKSDAALQMIAGNQYDAVEEIGKWQEQGKDKGFVGSLIHSATMPEFFKLQTIHRANAFVKWTEMVAQNNAWDHKPIIAAKFPTNGKSTRFHHKYKEYEYYYDIWSNIHYGYVGVYCGFSKSVLLDGAGLEQIGSDLLRPQLPESRKEANGSGLRQFDDTTDSLSIALGIELFETYPDPNSLTPMILMEAITKVDYPIRDGSKKLHKCADAYKQ